MKIGGVKLNSNVLLAPLAGYTDFGFRRLCVKYGAGLTYTEMVSAKGLCYGNANTKILLKTAENESPKAVQIFGNEPEFIEKAVCLPALSKFDIIDINMGCPVKKIVSNGEGSALMRDIPLAQEVVSAACAAGKPVTVKFRAGFDAEHKNAVEFALAMENAGAAAVTVHGRTREQFYAGKADWDIIAEVKKAVKIPVIANGDIVTRDDYLRVTDKNLCDAVMIGRAALGSPFVFAEIQDKPFEFSAKATIMQHIADLLTILPERTVTNLMKAHLCFYAKNTRQIKRIRTAVNASSSLSEILEIIDGSFI